jgi:GH24 family phage-related lysozyme (muramidase)
MITDAESLLVAEEGRETEAYIDSKGFWTNGIGHKYTDGRPHPGEVWSDAKVDAVFAVDFAYARDGIAAHWPAINSLDPVRQAYVVSMAFQLGVGGVLGFPHMLGCLAASDWQGAHDAALASKWHQETPERCERAAAAFLTGQWQQVP